MTARQPWPWPETMDALIAAPASHRVLLDNDQEHTHQASRGMIVDEPPAIRYHAGGTVRYQSPPRSGPPAQVQVNWL
jgi:hypothetical protein